MQRCNKAKPLFILFWLLPLTTLHAQQSNVSNERYVSTTMGYSSNSVILLGKTPDTRTFYSYFGYGKQIKSPITGVKAFVTRGIMPFLEFNYPKRDAGSRRDIVSGFGISPLGYNFVKPFKFFDLETGIKSGLTLINKTFPTDKGRRLNYSFDIKLAIQRQLFSKTYLSLGYKFHHISNAQTGSENPGVDSNFLFFSLKQF